MTRLLSNIIKSGFVAFANDEKLVINANENRIIKAIDTDIEEKNNDEQYSQEYLTDEEVLAQALIEDAGIEELTLEQEPLLDDDIDYVALAKEEAEVIIAKAHDEVQQLRADAFDEIETIKAQAEEEGYQAGYNRAWETLSGDFEKKEAALQQKEHELQEAYQQKEEILIREVESKMVDLLCGLIPSITGVIVENEKDVLLYMVNQAMQGLDNSKHFVIRVSGSDYATFVERKDEVYGARNPSVEIEIFEDSKLDSLQCMIETDHGVVDVSLDVQLENLNKALKLMIKE